MSTTVKVKASKLERDANIHVDPAGALSIDDIIFAEAIMSMFRHIQSAGGVEIKTAGSPNQITLQVRVWGQENICGTAQSSIHENERREWERWISENCKFSKIGVYGLAMDREDYDWLLSAPESERPYHFWSRQKEREALITEFVQRDNQT